MVGCVKEVSGESFRKSYLHEQRPQIRKIKWEEMNEESKERWI